MDNMEFLLRFGRLKNYFVCLSKISDLRISPLDNDCLIEIAGILDTYYNTCQSDGRSAGREYEISVMLTEVFEDDGLQYAANLVIDLLESGE